MFACLHSLSSPIATLVSLAEAFTPRFEVVGPLVMLDVSGLSRLFGTPREVGEQLRRASAGPVRIAIAPTQTAAALLALGRPGLVVIESGQQRAALAQLPVSVLGEFERLRVGGFVSAPHLGVSAGDASASARGNDTRERRGPAAAASGGEGGASAPVRPVTPPHVAEMEDVLPYFHYSLRRATDAAAAPHLASAYAREHRGASSGETSSASAREHRGASSGETATNAPVSITPAPSGGGWTHPRDAHAAANTRRARRAVTTPRELQQTHVGTASARTISRELRRNKTQHAAVEALLDTLRRWGIKTVGHFAALPPGEVYERLGSRGVLWQRLARGEDPTPLVPWVPEDPFEAALDLEWPIEGLEPLSFVLGRLVEPLSDRLERADRGAAIVHTHLRLVDKTVHARMLQLPAPMRDPKTLRTLVLLDLESNPPTAAIDHVRVLIEPTPARVTQWALFERAQPSPEQVSTLLARLTALMGESHVGSPRLVNSWKPGAFEMTPFAPASAGQAPTAPDPSASARGNNTREQRRDLAVAASSREGGPATALRRFRLPVPARVQVQEGRPVRIMTDRRGVAGGVVVQAAGPWRTSGEWWNDGSAGRSWDRDEWDVAISDGTIYRIYVERDIGQWFLEGVVD